MLHLSRVECWVDFAANPALLQQAFRPLFKIKNLTAELSNRQIV